MATIKKAQTGEKLNKVYTKNKPMMDSLKKKNSEILNKQYERQLVSKAKTKATTSEDIEVEKSEPAINRFKFGGKVKDKKWMQKVSKSIKARGTKGKCTPISKPGCSRKAKTLALTFKKIAAKRKAK